MTAPPPVLPPVGTGSASRTPSAQPDAAEKEAEELVDGWGQCKIKHNPEQETDSDDLQWHIAAALRARDAEILLLKRQLEERGSV